jgi:TRAP-type mannitol/chloroaromatic compound transport system permease large subunit
LLAGYPVALSLGGTALAFALIGEFFGLFEPAFSRRCPTASTAS